MAAEAAEVDLVADGLGFGGILPYREKSDVARNSKFRFKYASFWTPGTNFCGNELT